MKTPEEDLQAIEAAKLYAGKATFQAIADQLTVSRSYAQALVRRGIALSITEPVDPSKPENVDAKVVEHMELPQPAPLSYMDHKKPLAVDPYSQHNYELELTAINKKLTMTGFEILVYDNFCNNGYMGTFSDFCREAIQALYYRTTPQGRAM